MPSTEEMRIAAIYDDLAPTWDRRQGLVERVLMGSAMRRDLATCLEGDVLEIGTGTGVTLRHTPADHAIRSFTGVDLSRGMLDQAGDAAREAGVRFPVDLRRMTAGTLDFPDGSFDTVTTSLTLCTVPDQAHALLEMARVCRPDGRIVLLEHVLAGNPVLAWLQRRMTPVQAQAMGCHLDRQTDRTIRDLRFPIERERKRFFGVFRLIVARPPERA